MKLDLFLLVVGITFPLVSACTPDQINSAIEACKGDPSCYEIIDEAIEEELAARGITGGKMTNVEYERVKFFLETYTIGYEEHQYNFFKMTEIGQKSYYLDEHITHLSIIENMDALFNDFYGDYQNRLIPNLEIFELDIVNPNQKQLFYTGSSFDRVKYVIFKTGPDTFTYEIYGEEAFVFSIELDLESVFFRDKRYISPHTIYKYFQEELPWGDVFVTNPLLIENDWAFLEVTKIDSENGYLLTQHGYTHYNKGHPDYERRLPFVSKIFYLEQSRVVVAFNFGYSGSVDNFTNFLGISLYEYGFSNLNTPIKQGILTITLKTNQLDQVKTLQSWIDLIESSEDAHSEFVGFSREYLLSFFRQIFYLHLESELLLQDVINPLI